MGVKKTDQKSEEVRFAYLKRDTNNCHYDAVIRFRGARYNVEIHIPYKICWAKGLNDYTIVDKTSFQPVNGELSFSVRVTSGGQLGKIKDPFKRLGRCRIVAKGIEAAILDHERRAYG